MLTIRAAQIQALESYARQEFIRKTAADARRRLPGCCAPLPDADLWPLCELGIARAASYGITEPEDVIPFLDLVIAHGVDFVDDDEFGWAKPILKDNSLSADVKIAVLFDRIPGHLRPETVSTAGGER